MSFPRRLTASVRLDYRGGHKLAGDKERRRCAIHRNCRGGEDPSAPLDREPATGAPNAVDAGSSCMNRVLTTKARPTRRAFDILAALCGAISTVAWLTVQ